MTVRDVIWEKLGFLMEDGPEDEIEAILTELEELLEVKEDRRG